MDSDVVFAVDDVIRKFYVTVDALTSNDSGQVCEQRPRTEMTLIQGVRDQAPDELFVSPESQSRFRYNRVTYQGMGEIEDVTDTRDGRNLRSQQKHSSVNCEDEEEN